MLTLLALGLVAVGVTVAGPPLARHGLERALAGFFHRPVHVSALGAGLLPLRLEVHGLRVDGPRPGTEPFLEVERLSLTPRFTLPAWHRIDLGAVRVVRPRIRIHAPPQGSDDIPKMGGGGPSRFEVSLWRLMIEGGEFYLDHRRVPLELDLPQLRAVFENPRPGLLEGRLDVGPGPLRFGTNRPLPLQSEIELRYEKRRLVVTRARLRSLKTDAAFVGELRFGSRPEGEFRLSGPVDLGVLDEHIMRTGFGIKGAARYDGWVFVVGSRLSLDGRLEGRDGEFDAVPVRRYSGAITWNSAGVRLHALELEALGGSGRVDLDVPPAPSLSRLDAELRAVDAEGLVRAVWDWGAVDVAGATTGYLTLSWPRGRTRMLTGVLDVDVAPRPDGRRTPLGGKIRWRARDGVQFVDLGEGETPSTRVRLQGRIEADDRTDLAVEGESSDLRATDDLALRVRKALGTVEARLAGFTGRGSARGRWLGTLVEPVFEGRASGVDVGYLDVDWGRAEWAGSADPYEVRSHSLVLRKGPGALWLDGRVELGIYGEDDFLDVAARIEDWPAADFVEALRWDLDLTGLVSGETTVNGRFSLPRGSARLRARAGRYYGVPYDEAEVVATFLGTDFTGRGVARLGGGEVRFDGTLAEDGYYDGRGTLENVDLAAFFPDLPEAVRPSGRLRGQALLQGPLARPRLVADLSSPRIFLGDEGVGALTATLRGTGDGDVVLDGRCRSGRLDLALAGTVGAAEPYRADLRLVAEDTTVDPFARVSFPRLTQALGVAVTGDARLTGPLLEPRALRAEVNLTRLEARLPEFLLRNPRPVVARLQDGRASIDGLHLSGEGTDLALEGSAGVLGEGELDLTLRGAADLQILGAVTPRLRGRGDARLNLAVRGTRTAPRLDGRLDLAGAGLRVRGFPHGLENVRGSVTFDEKTALFREVTGTLGGGDVRLEGQAAYGSGRLEAYDVRLSGRSLALRYPEGLRSVLDGELRLFGDGERQWASGEIDVRQALWTRRYDLASELMAARAELEQSASLSEGVQLDLKLRAPGTLRVDNNLATLQARAELDLQGTSNAPIVLGRAEVDRGRVYFQGNTYVIRQGTLVFANPHRVDPVFDIEAETRLRAYRVTLRMNGTLDRVSPTLTSDPPLTPVQILTLLTGAEAPSLAEAQTGQARLAASGAATLAAGRLSEEVGLERGAERYLGLNRFSIDPSIVKGTQTDPTARLTVGKRITPDLNVVYSQDLRGTEERIFSVEYTFSDRLSLLLTRSEPGGVGFDVRFRHTNR